MERRTIRSRRCGPAVPHNIQMSHTCSSQLLQLAPGVIGGNIDQMWIQMYKIIWKAASESSIKDSRIFHFPYRILSIQYMRMDWRGCIRMAAISNLHATCHPYSTLKYKNRFPPIIWIKIRFITRRVTAHSPSMLDEINRAILARIYPDIRLISRPSNFDTPQRNDWSRPDPIQNS